MKIAIVGPGAMGCLFTALLTRTKLSNDIWLLDKDPERAKRIKAKGISVEGINNFKSSVNITADPKVIGHSDLVIICTKSYDTETALNSIKPLLKDDTNVLSLQNGIGNLQLIIDMAGEERTVCGMTANGATLNGDGKVRQTGKGETIIGKPTGKIFRDLRHISSTFNAAGILTKTSRDVNGIIWSKLIINAGINALAAICRLSNGALLMHEGAKELMRQAVIESTKVAKKKKAKLIFDDPLQKVESVCKNTSANICSMLQDILHRKRTEIDFINGAIVRHAKSSGVKVPVNEMLTQLVKVIESSYKEQVKR